MENNHHIINTRLYSDYAVKLLEGLRKEVSADKTKAINNEIYYAFRESENDYEMYVPQHYGFQHYDDGEVCLVDIELMPNRYCHFYGFNQYTINRYRELIALQLKKNVSYKIDIDGGDWNRTNFDVSVTFDGIAYPIAELYFVYDFLWNHLKSVNKFKISYPEIATKIIGSPRDPIIVEFIQNSKKKKREIYKEYMSKCVDLGLSEFKFPSMTKYDKEFAVRANAIYVDLLVESKREKEILHEKLLNELAKYEIPEEILVSNNIAL